MTNSVSISNGRNSNMRQCFTRLLGHQETYLIDVQILLFHLYLETFLILLARNQGRNDIMWWWVLQMFWNVEFQMCSCVLLDYLVAKQPTNSMCKHEISTNILKLFDSSGTCPYYLMMNVLSIVNCRISIMHRWFTLLLSR